MRAARFLTWANAAAITGAFAALVTLLVASPPPYPCDSDAASTPASTGGLAGLCFAYGVVSFLISLGLAMAAPGAERRWARRALATALLVVAVAGGAFFTDLARWTCWE